MRSSVMSGPMFGPYGVTDSRTAGHVAECGGNAIWFHGFNPKGFEAANDAGIAACVEYKTFRASFADNLELIPVGTDGRPIRHGRLVQGVCLSRTDFVEQRFTELEAHMKTYRPRGVWLDYLTYAGWFETPNPDLQDSCFCPQCVTEFCEAAGVDADTPTQILLNHADAWEHHKCDRIDRLGQRFAAIIRKYDQSCIVGVYMCPWTPDEFDRALSRIFAQDYRRFGEWVDVYTPLMYAHKNGRPPEWAAKFLESSPAFVPDSLPVQPILDDLDFPDSLSALADARVRPMGFQLFAGGRAFDDEMGRKQIVASIEKLRS